MTEELKTIYQACPYPDRPEEGLGKQLEDYAVYIGEYKNGKIHGQGTLTYHNGGEYVGEFRDGKKNGFGREHYCNGNYFKGVYSDVAPDEGTIFFYDGRIYHGKVTYEPAPFRHGEMLFPKGTKHILIFYNTYNGDTTLTDADVKRYEGDFSMKRYNGYGELTFQDGSVYRGDFYFGSMHGYGVFFFADGSKYAGEFFYGKRQGKGKETFPDGSYYEGEFRDNKRNGHGVLQMCDGSVRKGKFRNGKFIG